MLLDEADIAGIPERRQKPRDTGLTMMLDKGLSPRQVEDVLTMSGAYTDLAKLGWGTALITPHLRQKIKLYQEADVIVCCGGTLFEAMYLRDEMDTYCRLMDELGIEHVEVSAGRLPLSEQQKSACIRRLAEHFCVLSEVGSKDKRKINPPYKWINEIKSDLEAGSWKVICESRESGTAGLFRPNGEIRSGLVDEIASMVDIDDIIFEAPQKAHQVYFIQNFGPNVSLGNIAPEELMPLETLRLGLRGDTLFDFFRTDAVPQAAANRAIYAVGRYNRS